MSDEVIVTPSQEVNRSLLNTFFKFRTNSLLKRFLTMSTQEEKNIYSLAEVLTILKNVIRRESMFDTNNPSVILCSKPLEKALNMKALHVTEIRDLVLKQLEKLPEQHLQGLYNFQARAFCDSSSPSHLSRPNPTSPASVINKSEPAANDAPRPVRGVNINSSIYTNKEARFNLKPDFLKVMRSVPGLSEEVKSQCIFSYEEVTLLLSKYILSRKDKMFDPRNIKLAMVQDDPLGVAFGVQAFHRCQVNNLLRSQLIPLQPGCNPNNLVNDRTGSPGLGVLASKEVETVVSAATSSSLPAFPTISKAASTPNSLLDSTSSRSGQVRKRSISGEEEARAKMARGPSEYRVVVRPADSNSDTDTETIHSAQSYETVKVEDDMDSTEDEGTVRTSRVYEVEYDIDSGEEEERPPQAFGIGKDFSSADDTDTDAMEDIKVVPAIINMESDFWADSEEDLEVDIVDVKKNKSKCVSCGKLDESFLTYCNKCWEIRKSWAPERPKNKRKPRLASSKKNLAASLPVNILSDTETDGGSMAHEDKNRPRFDSKASISSQDSGIGSQELEIFSSQEISDFGNVKNINVIDPLNEEKNAYPSMEIPMMLDVGKFNRSMSLDQSSVKSSSGVSSMDMSESCSIISGDLDFNADPKELVLNKELLSKKFATSVTSPAYISLCEFCCLRPKNASLIHGRLAHQVCCYPCGKKLWKKKARCPVCRRKVERIVKNIQA